MQHIVFFLWVSVRSCVHIYMCKYEWMRMCICVYLYLWMCLIKTFDLIENIMSNLAEIKLICNNK